MADIKVLMNAIEEFENNTRWHSFFIKSLRLNSKFVLSNDENEYVLTEEAIPSLCERAEVKGRGIHRLNENKFVEHMNDYFDVVPSEKRTIINEYDGKLYACHSDNYKVLSIKDLVNAFIDKVLDSFEDANLATYSITPTETIVDFVIGDKKIVKTYEKALEKRVSGASGLVPVIRFVTSNTGWSGANLIPTLYFKNRPVITSAPIIMKHQGDASLKKFDKNLDKIYTLVLDGAEKIEELANVHIEYPAKCAANIAKEIGLSKRATLPFIYEMDENYGDMPCTAREVYLTLANSIEDCNDNPVKSFRNADILSRALTLDFTQYDRSKASWLDDRNTVSRDQLNVFQFVA